MYRLIFYTKLNCQLCEEAYGVLLDLINDIPLKIDIVDITQPHHQDVFAKYRQRIPVVAIPETETELDWPFTGNDVRAQLSS